MWPHRLQKLGISKSHRIHGRLYRRHCDVSKPFLLHGPLHLRRRSLLLFRLHGSLLYLHLVPLPLSGETNYRGSVQFRLCHLSSALCPWIERFTCAIQVHYCNRRYSNITCDKSRVRRRWIIAWLYPQVLFTGRNVRPSREPTSCLSCRSSSTHIVIGPITKVHSVQPPRLGNVWNLRRVYFLLWRFRGRLPCRISQRKWHGLKLQTW